MWNNNKRILIVGTTCDYIEHLYRIDPERVIFLTDKELRETATQIAPPCELEILCDLWDYVDCQLAVSKHLEKSGIALCGIACFDCESMELAALIAKRFGLRYPSLQSVLFLRDKFRSKNKWLQNNIACPEVMLIDDEGQLCDFLERCGTPIVIKPLTGSGSELVFYCENFSSARKALKITREQLARRSGSRMYGGYSNPPIIAEQYIQGDEYSCDVIINCTEVTFIRLTRKHHALVELFGTIVAYEIPADLSEFLKSRLKKIIAAAAEVAGLDDGICMVDFIVNHGQPVLLEMTPRLGGDCLVELIRQSCEIDVLKLQLDFAQGLPIDFHNKTEWRKLVGMRIFADNAGVLNKINTSKIESDPQVQKISMLRNTGDVIKLPPEDYDSWLLGHLIFEPHPGEIISQIEDLKNKITIEWN